jgi:molybdopterin/thiamine biosynthesis adenylyltransferase
VHGAALGWQATAFCTAGEGAPCLRCVFEDLPTEAGLDCSTGGVMGPVVGFGGALLAELALQTLTGQAPFGVFYSFSGKADRLRRIEISPRPDCPLCGRLSQIFEIDEQRYSRQICAA